MRCLLALWFFFIFCCGVGEGRVSTFREAVAVVQERAEGRGYRQRKLMLRLIARLNALAQGEAVDGRDQMGYTALMLAAQTGEKWALDFLLEKGANPQLRAPGDVSLLLLAAQGGDIRVYAEVQRRAPLAAVAADASGRTLFHYACLGGNREIVDRILREGGNAYTRDRRGCTSLLYAAMGGNELLFHELLSRGGNPRLACRDGYDFLMAAAHGGSPGLVRLALEMGFVPERADASGTTALMEAARYAPAEVAELLLNAGADASCRDHAGATAAMYAAAVGNVAVFRLLGGHASDAPDKLGRTPLVYAVCGGSAELVRQLLEEGADADVAGGLPLRCALACGHTQVALELAVRLPSVGQEELHAIPVHSLEDAVYFCRFVAERSPYPADRACARALLGVFLRAGKRPECLSLSDGGSAGRGGAKSEGRGGSAGGQTPLQYAIVADLRGVFVFLLESGVDVNARNRAGWTPLMTAVECGQEWMVRLLLRAGARVDAMDDRGMTALKLAASAGWLPVFNLLLEAGADPSQNVPGGVSTLACALAAGEEGAEMARRLTGKAILPTNQAEAYRALCEAMSHNDLPAFEKVLEAWPDVEAADEEGRTLLMYAAGRAAGDVFLQVLLSRGADVNAADAQNRMPLDYVTTPSRRRLLLEAGAVH